MHPNPTSRSRETRPVPHVYHKYFSSTCVTVSGKRTMQVVLKGRPPQAVKISAKSDRKKPRNASSTSRIPQVLFQYLCDSEREMDYTGGLRSSFPTRDPNFILIRPMEAEKRVQYLFVYSVLPPQYFLEQKFIEKGHLSWTRQTKVVILPKSVSRTV